MPVLTASFPIAAPIASAAVFKNSLSAGGIFFLGGTSIFPLLPEGALESQGASSREIPIAIGCARRSLTRARGFLRDISPGVTRFAERHGHSLFSVRDLL